MGSFTHVAREYMLHSDRIHSRSVGIRRVHHHRRINTVESTLTRHLDLAATTLFGRCTHQSQSTARFYGQACERKPCTHARRRDDVVPACVANTR